MPPPPLSPPLFAPRVTTDEKAPGSTTAATKRDRDVARKKKRMEDIFERKNKENLRVIQRDLVYAVGIPVSLAREEVPL